MTTMIHHAMLKAMTEIATKGIGKARKADQMGGAKYNYRGIEDAMNEMSVVLIHAGITVTPSYSELQFTERARDAGKATRIVIVKGAFQFAADDGSSVVCECYGEAADTMDKAVTKAQSVAFRTALFQQFIVPTMAMDPEATPEDDDGTPVPAAALAAAEKGVLAYQAHWKKLSREDKKALEPHHDELKKIAQESDQKGGEQ